MPRKPTNVSGKKFGCLTVIERDPSKYYPYWVCLCECGNKKSIYVCSLTSGATRSCGCLGKARRTTHGMTHTRTYNIWSNAKMRCTNPKNPAWKNYGGRGIKMCEQWVNSFESFYKDMGECPPNLTLERVDNNGNYEPGNCVWIPKGQQSRNTRRLHFVEFRGERMLAVDFSRLLGISYIKVLYHLNYSKKTTEEIASRYGKYRRSLVDFPFELRRAKGSGNGSSKLIEAQVLEIRSLYKRGWTYQSLAEKYGVCVGTIGNVVRRSLWKHV